jgi:hypothetical protein
MENPLSINIDGIVFTLIEKTELSNEYIVVRIQSLNPTTREILADFWVYRSNSELGFWRLCSSVSDNPKQMYKGDPDEFNYDYIQTTFIHLSLQFFINARFEMIPSIPYFNTQGINYTEQNKKLADKDLILSHNLYPHYDKKEKKIFVLSKTLIPEYKEIVDDNNRIIEEDPFKILYDISKCGEELNEPSLNQFSNSFQEQYTVESDLPVQGGRYNYEFEEVVNVAGQINCITLKRNIPNAGKTNNIELYYLDAHLCSLQNTGEFIKNIEYVCTEDKHIMPFLLIPVGAVVNILGLYSKYIISGAYICKLFDYAVQCSPDENSERQCTINYTHIGYRYNNLFPFKIEQSTSKRARRSSNAEGTNKKGKRNKRKTRKQQKTDKDKRKERNNRKERRSKNKNKSKKYGI